MPNYWRGDAPAVSDVWTVTVTGPATGAGTLSVPIGTKFVTVAFADTETAAVIAARLADALTQTSVLEFGEAGYAVDAGVITATGKAAGVPVEFGAPVVTAAVGVAAVAANPTVATGPNFGDETANWSAGHLPGDGGPEEVVIDGGPDILFGLAGIFAGPCSLTRITDRFTGAIGLPRRNTTGGGDGYWEYRDRAADFTNAGPVFVGERDAGTQNTGGGGGPARCLLLLGDAQTAFVYATGTDPDGGAAVEFGRAGGTPGEVRVFGGSVGWGVTLPTGGEILPLAAVVAGEFQAGGDVTEVRQRGGSVTARGRTYTLTIGGGDYTQAAGRIDAVEATGGAVKLLHDQGANTIAAHFRTSGTGDPPYLDLTQTDRGGRVLAAGSYFRGGAYILDPYKTCGLDATEFTQASFQASLIGDEFQITRPATA